MVDHTDPHKPNRKGMLSAPHASKGIVYIFIFLGLIVSLIANDFSWLSRFGCLITLVAILLTFSLEPDLFNTTKDDPYFKDLILGKVEPENDHEHFVLKAATIGSKTDEDVTKREVILLRSELALRALRWIMIRQQIRYASIGTLLWGFGDIPNLILGWS